MKTVRKPQSASVRPQQGGLDKARHKLARPEAPPLHPGWIAGATAAFVAAATFGLGGLAIGDPLNPNIASRSDIDIRTGRNETSGRIEIYGSVGSRASVRRQDGNVVVRLPGGLKPDLGDVRANPPLGIKTVEVKGDARATELWLAIADGYTAQFGRADGAVFIQLDSAETKNKKAPGVTLQQLLTDKASGKAEVKAEAPSATPAPMVVVEVASNEGGRDISFAFPGPVASAIFRRGENVWIVFDTDADLRLPAELKDGAIVQDVQWTRNDGFTAMRLKAPSTGSLSADSDGLTWRVRLGGKALNNQVTQVTVTRDDATGVPSLNANLAGATRVAWIKDPSVGDRMAVITARGPVKNLVAPRTTLEATLSSTAHGLAVEHMAPDVKVVVYGDLVEVTRPSGLTLSPSDPDAKPDDSRLEYKNALFASLINPDWSAKPEEGFLPRYNALQVAAANESQSGSSGANTARLSLARFLVGQGMNYEAQGVLDLLVRQNPKSLEDPQVRGLRVAAKMLTGRYADTKADLTSSQLATDPAARLWEAYGEYKEGNFAEAIKDFQAGLRAMDQFPVEWRMRFGAAYADAAMRQNDLKTADKMIVYAVNQNGTPLQKLAAYLVYGQIIEASGDKRRALNVFDAVSRASDNGISTPAIMNAARLKYELGKAKADETLNTLDSLRFRWRGDGTELKVIASMGDIYLSQGRYRDALQVLKTAGQQFGNDPEALKIQDTLNQSFRNLFLGGMADGLQPVEALGLFNDFRELTPVGTDGDQMVRKIVRRLVDVDLLDQAAALLQYQIDNRLDGVAKSAVAADLAAIYLMDRDPQKALQALWKTRTTLLPKPIMAERRILEARALSQLGKPEEALEVLGKDASSDADDVRADIYWQQQDWAKAAAILERRLGERWKKDGTLALTDEGRIIRVGVAYSLLKDDKALVRLSDRWAKFIATASSPDAMRVALAPLDGGEMTGRDFAAAAAATDSFAGWVSGMKRRFREKAPLAPAVPPAKTA